MKALENIPYNKRFLIDERFLPEGFVGRVYLEKSYLNTNDSDQYFLKLFKLSEYGSMDCLGFLYFYLDFNLLESKFIGILIKPEYRNKGLAYLLVANWIKLCMDNNIINLQTNKKQRKPALLYLLKNYSFEIDNPELYKQSNFTIDICEGLHDHMKYLHFKSEAQKDKFVNSPIMKEGNYCILDSLNENYQVLDNVLLSSPYYLQDENKAYTRTLKMLEKH